MKSKKMIVLSAIGATLMVASIGVAVAHMHQGMMMKPPKAVQKAVKTIEGAKKMAAKKGMYACCMKMPCNFCMEHMGACKCGMNASAGKPVCIECKGGWDAGMGAIPGLKPSDIKTMPMSIHGMKGM